MASEIAALRARVQTLESENGKLASTLRKQESASRTMTESLQGELARIQHLCNELSCTMVLQGVDPSVLSAVTSKHLRFDPAVRARNRFPCAPPSLARFPRTPWARRRDFRGSLCGMLARRRSIKYGRRPRRRVGRARPGARNRKKCTRR